ncbi:TIGR03086 family metal-binding protein [Amycolatopsis anabasis]|uniref:TIGR03086 family metal-binding protein n=1 Tax=Amycolatopsis anabasis TaxID=1840409 RepID=UPI00131D9A42|nr:TIGR03086 family metal-binding protein [Amycolatopsis anabasis]
MNDIMDRYRRSQDGFDRVLAGVPADAWDHPSACADWTIADVTGHVIWGQHLVRHWARGEEYTEVTGAPGTPHPAPMAGADPVAAWRAARERSLATLDADALRRPVDTRALGTIPLEEFLEALVTDFLAHTWDIGHPLGQDIRLDPELVAGSFAWARTRPLRAPGGLGPELTPPPGADEQTRYLAFLGRRA